MAALRKLSLKHLALVNGEDNIGHRPITTFPGGPVDAPLKKAAKRLGISTTQVVFLWVKAKGAVIVT